MATPAKSSNASLAVGSTLLGKYQVVSILGTGGMGVVAKARHMGLNEEVAIKLLRQDILLDSDAAQRFMREAQAAVKLKSEHVARVTDVGTFENGKPYMIMEYLDGKDLEQFTKEVGKVSATLAIDLILQAAEALAEAHSLGIVHRDIKPTNLFITWRPDGSPLLKVLDFGISKTATSGDLALTQTQSVLGTPAYMSPEQMRSAKTVDGRSDLWSLATVLYEMFEGHRPFEADSFSEMCVKVAVDAPTPMGAAPAGLARVILRCLNKTPEARYATIADFAFDLLPFTRDPEQARRSVDRMHRMLGRRQASVTGWDQESLGDGVPRSVRDSRSARNEFGSERPSGSELAPWPYAGTGAAPPTELARASRMLASPSHPHMQPPPQHNQTALGIGRPQTPPLASFVTPTAHFHNSGSLPRVPTNSRTATELPTTEYQSAGVSSRVISAVPVDLSLLDHSVSVPQIKSNTSGWVWLLAVAIMGASIGAIVATRNGSVAPPTEAAPSLQPAAVAPSPESVSPSVDPPPGMHRTHVVSNGLPVPALVPVEVGQPDTVKDEPKAPVAKPHSTRSPRSPAKPAAKKPVTTRKCDPFDDIAGCQH